MEREEKREMGEWRGSVEVDCGTTQRVAPAKAAQRKVCICVCVSGPMCLSRQQRTSLPHHRSIVEALLPRLTVGPRSHLSQYSDPLFNG